MINFGEQSLIPYTVKYLLYDYAEIPTHPLELPKMRYCHKQNLNVLEGTNEPAINLLTSTSISDKGRNAYAMSLATETHTLVSTESSDSDHDYISN
ncbi:MAG: hypothetical protein OXE77_01535 [Flavobacteriaceae bacterium]|nr:hypothetical protein [Flavobacteriaceae bacterium]MCY4267258.1 hypothetical protein [Flavobacteriaceae bacterium]